MANQRGNTPGSNIKGGNLKAGLARKNLPGDSGMRASKMSESMGTGLDSMRDTVGGAKSSGGRTA